MWVGMVGVVLRYLTMFRSFYWLCTLGSFLMAWEPPGLPCVKQMLCLLFFALAPSAVFIVPLLLFLPLNDLNDSENWTQSSPKCAIFTSALHERKIKTGMSLLFQNQ